MIHQPHLPLVSKVRYRTQNDNAIVDLPTASCTVADMHLCPLGGDATSFYALAYPGTKGPI